jgi:hypothetical protein
LCIAAPAESQRSPFGNSKADWIFTFWQKAGIQRLTFWNDNRMTKKKAQLLERTLHKLQIERNNIIKKIQRKRRELRTLLISQTESTSVRRCLNLVQKKQQDAALPLRD